MVAFRAWGKAWYEELKKVQTPPIAKSQKRWLEGDEAHREFWEMMGKGTTSGVWSGKGLSMLERQQLFSEFVRGNPWYESKVIGMYGGTEMQKVGKSVYRKHKAVDPLNAIVNRRLGVNVAHWYSSKSKVMSSSARASAVKLESGEKGWIIGGRFMSEHRVQMTLRSLDHTVYAEDLDWSLEQTYLNATPSGKREIMEMLEDVDWEAFWKNYYPQDDGYESDLTYPSDVFYGIADRIEALTKRRRR